MARRSGHRTALMTSGMLLVAVGVLILISAGLIQLWFFDGDLPSMPFFVVPSALCVVAGVVLLGIFILRSGILPRWLGILLVVSAALLLPANEQTVMILLAIPFGLVMAVVGFFMWKAAGDVEANPGRSRRWSGIRRAPS